MGHGVDRLYASLGAYGVFDVSERPNPAAKLIFGSSSSLLLIPTFAYGPWFRVDVIDVFQTGSEVSHFVAPSPADPFPAITCSRHLDFILDPDSRQRLPLSAALISPYPRLHVRISTVRAWARTRSG
jgi:hypothetical protein